MLIRLNQIMRGWANYFKHAACKRTLSRLSHFVWWRVIGWLRRLHRWRWKDVRRPVHHTHRAVDTDHGRTGSRCSTWRRCRSPATATGATPSPTPGPCPTTPARQEPWRARCGESRTPGSASGLGKRTESNPGTAPQADSTRRRRSCLCADEKSQVQALDRTQASLPMVTGRRRDDDPRLQAPRHHHPVRRAGRADRHGHRPVHASAPASGMVEVPQGHRPARCPRTCRSI